MKTTQNRKVNKWLLSLMLVLAMAFTAVGCGNKQEDANVQTQTEVQEDAAGQTEETTAQAEETDSTDADAQATTTDDAGTDAEASSAAGDVTVLGEGQMAFTFTVVDADGNETYFEIHTDKETVGDALLEHELIAGEEGDYGLYVKTVNGITADYDVDQSYWAFYINDEYAQTGVDATNVEDGAAYAFKVEK